MIRGPCEAGMTNLRSDIEEIANLQLATIPPRVHTFNAVARLANDLARPSNDSINGVFGCRSLKIYTRD
jgi:hypothetical protein